MADSVFVNRMSAIHKGSPGKSMAFPDVNLCPPAPPAGPVPTPLPNIAQAADLAGGATTVKIEGNPMAKKSSYFAKSTGNAMARSTGGGVLTHVVEGKAYFASFSMNVKIEGEFVPRHLDMMTHNHAAPTPGEAVGTYMGTMQVAMPKVPLFQEPQKREEEDKPFDYEISVTPPPSGAFAYWLRSEDGAYDAQGVLGSARTGGQKACTFRDVAPGKLYGLFLKIGDAELSLFEKVPSSLLQPLLPADDSRRALLTNSPAEAAVSPPPPAPTATLDEINAEPTPDAGYPYFVGNGDLGHEEPS